jgi:hypothetical protein
MYVSDLDLNTMTSTFDLEKINQTIIISATSGLCYLITQNKYLWISQKSQLKLHIKGHVLWFTSDG